MDRSGHLIFPSFPALTDNNGSSDMDTQTYDDLKQIFAHLFDTWEIAMVGI
jgi:hypothetical protein